MKTLKKTSPDLVKLIRIYSILYTLLFGISTTVNATFYQSGDVMVEATASCEWPNLWYPTKNTVNGAGLDTSGYLHSNQAVGTWISCDGGGGASNPNPGTVSGEAWIRFEFDRIYQLNAMWVWQFNQINFEDRGFRNVTIEYSTTGSPGEWTELTGWGGVFPIADGQPNMPPTMEIGNRSRGVNVAYGPNNDGKGWSEK